MASLGNAALGMSMPTSKTLAGDLAPGAGMALDTATFVPLFGSGSTAPTVPTSGITWPRTR